MKLSMPRARREFVLVWYRNFLLFKKNWFISLFWTVFEPVVILLGIGFGLGAYISNIQNLPYIDFFFPSVLAITAMMVSFFEATYNTYPRIQNLSIYNGMMLTRIAPEEIALGEILWSASKGIMSVIGVMVFASFFGVIENYRIIYAFPIYILLSFLFSSFGIIILTKDKNNKLFTIYTSGVIVPMALLSGTYFPLEQLPPILKQLAYVSPITHAVLASRSINSNKFDLMFEVNCLFLLGITLFMLSTAHRKMKNKLGESLS